MDGNRALAALLAVNGLSSIVAFLTGAFASMLVEMDRLLFLAVIFFACFTQTLTGFGSALVAMPVLVGLLGLRTAAPTVALIGLVLEVGLLLRYRRSFAWAPVRRMIAGSLVGIPIGVWGLKAVDEQAALLVLGVFVVAYALYALAAPRLPDLRQPIWAYVVGLSAGVLGGAFNTSGPPVIVYGHARRWPTSSFKANLQGFFLVVTAWVVLVHGISGNLNPMVWRSFALSLAPMALGTGLGFWLDSRLQTAVFRRVVLVGLLLLGIQLILR